MEKIVCKEPAKVADLSLDTVAIKSALKKMRLINHTVSKQVLESIHQNEKLSFEEVQKALVVDRRLMGVCFKLLLLEGIIVKGLINLEEYYFINYIMIEQLKRGIAMIACVRSE